MTPRAAGADTLTARDFVELSEVDVLTQPGVVTAWRPRPGRWSNRLTTFPEMQASDWIDAALIRLNDVAELPANWDNEGSPRTSNELVVAAFELLVNLGGTFAEPLPAPDVCSIAGGGFQFEWSVRDRHLELIFVEEKRLFFLQEEETDQGLVMSSGEFPMKMFSETRRWLEWLTQG